MFVPNGDNHNSIFFPTTRRVYLRRISRNPLLMTRVVDQGDLNTTNQKEKKTDWGISDPTDREKEKSHAAQANAQEKSSTTEKLQCS
ncbi:hypothetical protein U1Q18_028183 [Sarracenia purpurea var. burkii]